MPRGVKESSSQHWPIEMLSVRAGTVRWTAHRRLSAAAAPPPPPISTWPLSQAPNAARRIHSLTHETKSRACQPARLDILAMAEDRQPADIVEGATTGDVEDEVQPTAKSAEDRKAAAALSKLDTHGDDEAAPAREVDQEAVKNAMNALGGGSDKKEVKKAVKVDAADVNLLVRPYTPGAVRQRCSGMVADTSYWHDRSRSWSCRRPRPPNCSRHTTETPSRQ